MVSVFSLGNQPLANAFALPDESQSAFYPLEVKFCQQCTNAQLSVVVPAEVLYSNYLYVTSKSRTMQEHFAALWKEIQAESSAKYVLEIGSNDGEFLIHCKANGATTVIGVEPARNLAAIAEERGIMTFAEAFGTNDDCVHLKRKPDVIVARHVFAHVDDWSGFISGLNTNSKPETLIVIEAPYILDTLQRCEWDQIYAEHLSFISLKAMAALLKDTPFQMHKVLRFPVHGGAIAIFLRRRDSGIAGHESADRMLAQENITQEMWSDFEEEARMRIATLGGRVFDFNTDGKKVAAFGASAKSTVWINACGFTKTDIAFICDNTPQKQGRLSPGTDIPIVPEDYLTRENADVVINFAWNWHDIVKEKLKSWIDAGGVLVNPHEL